MIAVDGELFPRPRAGLYRIAPGRWRYPLPHDRALPTQAKASKAARQTRIGAGIFVSFIFATNHNSVLDWEEYHEHGRNQTVRSVRSGENGHCM
jgi:hypothetical protein